MKRLSSAKVIAFLAGSLILACVPLSVITPTPTLAPTLTAAPPTGTPVPATPASSEPPLPPTPALDLGPAIPHITVGQQIKITYIQMNSASTGWSIGGLGGNSDHVFRTQDGGLTWRDVTPPEPAPTNPEDKQAAIGFFRDASLAWVVYYPQAGYPTPEVAVVWYSRDGGASWQASQPLDPSLFSETFVPSDMQFVDDQHGWFLAHLGAGMMHDYVALFATTDGGATWPALLSPFNDGGIQSCAKTGLDFVDAYVAWMTTDCWGVVDIPYLFHTYDSGQTWSRITLSPPAADPTLFDQSACRLDSPDMLSDSNFVFSLACKKYGEATPPPVQPYLYFTINSGGNWTIRPYPGGALKFFSIQYGFALGRQIYKTEDEGQTWTLVKQVNWDGQFSFVTGDLIWAVARNGDEIALVKSTNAAVKWEEIKPQLVP